MWQHCCLMSDADVHDETLVGLIHRHDAIHLSINTSVSHQHTCQSSTPHLSVITHLSIINCFTVHQEHNQHKLYNSLIESRTERENWLLRIVSAQILKVKVRLMWICIAPCHDHTSKALRYGTYSQGISQFYLHTLRSSVNEMNHTCLCLLSQSWYSFTDPGGIESWAAHNSILMNHTQQQDRIKLTVSILLKQL